MVLDRLEKWFREHCNGDWEHTYGIKLETVDNPGWILTIDLRDTGLSGVDFTAVKDQIETPNWLHCSVKDEIFRASGGIGRLSDMLETFLNWADTYERD